MITTSKLANLPAKTPVTKSGGMITSHDLPDVKMGAADAGKPTQMITTGDLDTQGHLSEAAKKRLGRNTNEK